MENEQIGIKLIKIYSGVINPVRKWTFQWGDRYFYLSGYPTNWVEETSNATKFNTQKEARAIATKLNIKLVN